MADSNFKSNLDDSDVLAGYPSAGSPLSIDDLIKARVIQETPNGWTQGWPAAAGGPGATPAAKGGPRQTASLPGADSAGAVSAPVINEDETAPAAPATPAPSEYAPIAKRGLSQLEQNLTAATQAEQQIPSSSPAVTELDKEIAQRSAPTTLREQLPTDQPGQPTGPILPQYQASLGRKIWRGIEGGLLGLAEGGLGGALVGGLKPQAAGSTAYGAPNAAYNRAEQARQTNLANLTNQRAQALEEFKQAQDAQAKRAADFRAQASLGRDLMTGATGAMKDEAEAAKAANETPEAKARAKQLEDQQAFNEHLTQLQQIERRTGPVGPVQAAYFLAEGKFPPPREPRQPNEFESAYSTLLTSFRRSNGGRLPNYQENLQLVEAARGKGEVPAENADKAGAIVAEAVTAKNAYMQAWRRNPDGSYTKSNVSWKDPKSTISGQEFNSKVDEFRTKANKDLSRLGYDWDAQGNLNPVGGAAVAQNAGRPGAAAAAPAGHLPAAPTSLAGAPAGAVGVKMGNDGFWHWTDKATGGADLGRYVQ